MKNRAGEFVTNLSGKMAYKSFKPNPLITENANRDVSDVINYIKATEFAVED